MDLQSYGFEFSAMASTCEVRLAAANQGQAHRMASTAINEVRRIEAKYSRYRADSVVGRINAAAGGTSIACDAETNALFDYAQTLYEASQGLFDITSGVLRRAWNFKLARVPTADELRPLLDLIGWTRVERTSGSIRLPRAGMEIDLGGFGKEYAADRAAALLLEAGVSSGFVNLGGDLRVIGPQIDGAPWSIGIQDPRDLNAAIASLPVERGALATSGDYERFFELDGRRYCHVLDPRTGYPVTAWRSITVVAPLAIAAGSCTTIAMLLADRALPFLRQSGNLFLAIDARGQLFRN